MKFFHKSGLLNYKELFSKAILKKNHRILKQTPSFIPTLALRVFTISTPIRI